MVTNVITKNITQMVVLISIRWSWLNSCHIFVIWDDFIRIIKEILIIDHSLKHIMKMFLQIRLMTLVLGKTMI